MGLEFAHMRRLLVLLALAAFVFAPSAMALGAPPVGLKQIKVVKLKQTKSCSAHGRNTKTAAGRTARKLKPVACEQPPRAKVMDAGLFIIFVAP